MASVQTPVRQPFGVLDSYKLRNLQSIKNRQNAIAPSSAPSLKRRHIALDLSDSENVDPNEIKESSSKRMKTNTEDDLRKPSTFILKPFSKPKSRISIASSLLTPRPSTPTITTTTNNTKASLISSAPQAPAAAGRSPTKSKRSGILSNRRTRLSAPAFGSRSSRAPLSLAAAVSGTLANKKHRQRVISPTTLEDSKPKSWFFDIYEETAVQQDFIVNEWTLTQSAGTLDISDDESKSPSAWEERGKENIPPSDGFAPASAAAAAAITAGALSGISQPASSRKDMMTDEPRTPLGDLNPADYFPDGHDATSVVLVTEEEEQEEEKEEEEGGVVGPEVEMTTLQELQTPSAEFNFNTPSPLIIIPSAPPPRHGQLQEEELLSSSELSALLLVNNIAPTTLLPTTTTSDTSMGVEHHGVVGASSLFFVNKKHAEENNNEAEIVEPLDIIEIWESASAKDECEGEGAEMDVGEGVMGEL